MAGWIGAVAIAYRNGVKEDGMKQSTMVISVVAGMVARVEPGP